MRNRISRRRRLWMTWGFHMEVARGHWRAGRTEKALQSTRKARYARAILESL